MKTELLERKLSIEAMLYELKKNTFEFNYQINQDGHITLLFFAHLESLILLKQLLEHRCKSCVRGGRADEAHDLYVGGTIRDIPVMANRGQPICMVPICSAQIASG